MKLQFRYLRDKKGRPRGVAVMDKENPGAVGWALCRKNEKFIKSLGRNIAVGRLKTNAMSRQLIPHSMLKTCGELIGFATLTYYVPTN